MHVLMFCVYTVDLLSLGLSLLLFLLIHWVRGFTEVKLVLNDLLIAPADSQLEAFRTPCILTCITCHLLALQS